MALGGVLISAAVVGGLSSFASAVVICGGRRWLVTVHSSTGGVPAPPGGTLPRLWVGEGERRCKMGRAVLMSVTGGGLSKGELQGSGVQTPQG